MVLVGKMTMSFASNAVSESAVFLAGKSYDRSLKDNVNGGLM